MTGTQRNKAKRRAKRRANREAEPAPKRPNCPTPDKKAYTEDSEAIGRALNRSKKIGRPLRVYTCECGYLHLTKKVNLIANQP